MSKWIPWDEWTRANDAAVERKHGPADRSGMLEKLLAEGGFRTCKTSGCNIKVKGSCLYCEKCRVEQKRLYQRDWHRKKRKREMLEMLEGDK